MSGRPQDLHQSGPAPHRDHREDLAWDLRNRRGGGRPSSEEYNSDSEWSDLGADYLWSYWPVAGADAAVTTDESPEDQPEPISLGGWSMVHPAGYSAFYGVRPLLDADEMDLRFLPLKAGSMEPVVSIEEYRLIVEKAIPGGTPLLMLPGTDETDQRNLAYPFLELISDQRGSAPTVYSTPIFDIRNNSVDWLRGAGLHSLATVERIPQDNRLGMQPDYALAWNHTLSFGDGLGQGLIVSDGPTGRTLAYTAYEAYGPLHPGWGAADLHYIDSNDDDVPLCTGGIGTRAFFIGSPERNGPIYFEDLPWPHPGNLPVAIEGHIVYDFSLPHPWLGETRPGYWRVFTSSAIRPPQFIPRRPVPTEGIPPLKIIEFIPNYPGGGGQVGGGINGRVQVHDAWEVGKNRIDPKTNGPVDPARTPYELAIPSIFGVAVRRPEAQDYDGRLGGADVDNGQSLDHHALYGGEPSDNWAGIPRYNPNEPQGKSVHIDLGEVGTSSAITTPAKPPAKQSGIDNIDDGADEEDWTGSGPITNPHTGETFGGRAAKAKAFNRDNPNRVPLQAPLKWPTRPLVYHIETFSACPPHGEYDYVNKPGDWFASGTVDGLMYLQPAELARDFTTPDDVTSTGFAVYGGIRDGVSLGSAAIIGSGVPDEDSAGLTDGWYFQADGVSDFNDCSLLFKDANGAERMGSLTVCGNILPGLVGSNFGDVGSLTAEFANGYFTDLSVSGKLSVGGVIDPPTGLQMSPQAAVPVDDLGANYTNILWVKTGSPTTLWWTDSAGTDHQIV